MTDPVNSIALVDCNNFFVSCERVFRPDLQNKPVICLSNNDGNVISRSNEAKALGVKMGVPLFKIRDLVREHKITVFSSKGTVKLSQDGSRQSWKMRQEHKSPAYTTDWDELPTCS